MVSHAIQFFTCRLYLSVLVFRDITFITPTGLQPDDFADDALNRNSVVQNYWSLLSPLIFSDHPKRPGDEDPATPFNFLRNVLDMNARFGGFNAALLGAGKSVWVMNVVPTSGPNYLPLILDRGFIGVQHDWYVYISSLSPIDEVFNSEFQNYLKINQPFIV